MALLEAIGLVKTYTDMAEPVRVLEGLDLSLGEGELVGIFGASGAGKSTLLHILGGLDRPTAGRVIASGRPISEMGEEELARFRNREVGFVFQFYHLLPEFSALENVMLPALIGGIPRGRAKGMAEDALRAVGLMARADHKPASLSGGEQQRIAIARAAVMRPKLMLADEPTGNLDPATGDTVMEYLLTMNRNYGTAMVVVTHNRDLLGRLPRAYELKGGRLHAIGGAR